MRLAEYDSYDILSLVFGGEQGVVALDVGANVGEAALRLEAELPGVAVHAFEPVPEVYEALCRATEGRSIRAWPLAVGARGGTVEMRVLRERLLSSVLTLTEASAEAFGEKGVQAGVVSVPMTTLDAWAAGAGVGAAQILKIDVQGLELDVLRGAEKLLAGVQAVNSEAQLVQQYRGAATFSEIDGELRRHGFEFFHMQEIWAIGRTERHSCMDGLWLRPGLVRRLEAMLGREATMMRLVRARRALLALAARGHRRIGIYGGGWHTRTILGVLERSPVEIACIIDDAPSLRGARAGRFTIAPARDVLGATRLDAVLLSSDVHEDRLWAASEPFRQAGVEVVRLYGPGASCAGAGRPGVAA